MPPVRQPEMRQSVPPVSWNTRRQLSGRGKERTVWKMQEMIQGSEEWIACRLGNITASRIKDVMAKTKTGPSASRKNYAAELALERMSGSKAERFVNAAMTHGTENEPFARAAYELMTGQMVDEVGYITHPSIERSGASPDGLVGDHGVLEIKCPNTSTHIEWAVYGKVSSRARSANTVAIGLRRQGVGRLRVIRPEDARWQADFHPASFPRRCTDRGNRKGSFRHRP